MTDTQIICILLAVILALIGVIVIMHAKMQHRPVKSIIRVTGQITPVELKFEHEFDPMEAEWRNLHPDEADWQRRREIATSFSNHIFAELMRKDTELMELISTQPPYSRYPVRITAKMYLLPIKKL
jgi:hypothetical protein